VKHAIEARITAAVAIVAAAVVLLGLPAPAAAQPDPNPGALTFTGGVDVPSVYVFRGIVKEDRPELTIAPFGDLGIALGSGDGTLKSVRVNVGTWHSLQTGSSGSGGPSEKIHAEEDFYASLSLGFGAGLTFSTTYTAYTSPNFMFNNVKEISVRFAKTGMLNPYGLAAFELDDHGQADRGVAKGTYVELGVAPDWTLGARTTLTVPVKLGLSGKDYYELAGEDHKFGYLDVGGLITVPLGASQSRFGSWNVHGGAELYTFGDTTRAFNGPNQKKTRVVVSGGIGVSY
jgi:hypothetical protein